MADKSTLGLGLIGSGFMGKTHTFGFAVSESVFDLPYKIERRVIADISTEAAEAARQAFGFQTATANWRDLLTDPDIHIVDITAPNVLHHEMAMAAIAAGKHVYCEKPLAPQASLCEEMTLAAEAAGVKTQVGFNYIKNPMIGVAKQIIDSGEIGEVRAFRGIHAEDYMTDPSAHWTWRLDPAGGGGAFADLGSHVVETACYLLGPIAEVMGNSVTAVKQRPAGPGSSEMREVQVDDITRAFGRFENGATGTFEANWMATGRKMQHDFEVYGSKGGLFMTLERLNELNLYLTDNPAGRQGFRRIYAGPDHEPYGAFCVAPGHQLGFNELKAIEIRDFMTAIAGGPTVGPDFREGWEVQKVVEAVYRSSKDGSWQVP